MNKRGDLKLNKLRKFVGKFRLSVKKGRGIGKGFMEAEEAHKTQFLLGSSSSAPAKIPGVLLEKVKQNGLVETQKGAIIKFDPGNEVIRVEYKDGTMVLYSLNGEKLGKI